MEERRKRPSNRYIRKAIRDIMEPEIAAMGFVGTYPEFRRTHDRETHFLWFFTRKYGGGFSYSGAWAKRGPFRHWDGEILAEQDVGFVHTGFDNRATAERIVELCSLDGKRVRQSAGDFDYGYICEDAEACCALVAEAAETLTQMDKWLKTREAGEAISCKGHRPVSGVSKQLQWHLACAQVGGFDLAKQRPKSAILDAG